MSYTYEIDLQRRIVFAKASGVVTIDELVSARRALAANPNFDRSFPVIADLRGVTEFVFGMRELESFAEMTKAQRSKITAIVVSNPMEYGYARMFQTLRENTDYPTGQIFYDMGSALRWVKEQREGS
jgi:hypothetical protein